MRQIKFRGYSNNIDKALFSERNFDVQEFGAQSTAMYV